MTYSKVSYALCMAFVGALTACGGGGGGGSSSSSSSNIDSINASIQSHDLLIRTKVNQALTISLEPSVKLEDSDSFSLQNVTLLSNNSASCQLIKQDAQSFDVLASDVTACEFEYQVKTTQGDASSKALARVSAAQTYSETQLEPLSAVTDIQTPVTIDLSAHISAGFSLVDAPIFLGSGGSLSHDATSITYSPTGSDTDVGVQRVIFSVTDGENIELGTIDIAVAKTIDNSQPIANNYEYPDLVEKGQTIVISLDSETVSDPDGDNLSLVSVSDYNGEAKPADEDDLSKLQISFTPQVAGVHYIRYVVQDDNGMMNIGFIKVNVSADFSLIQNWQDIDQNLTFTAPVSLSLANYANLNFTDYIDEDGSLGPHLAQVVTFDYQQAIDYCNSRDARLPSEAELQSLAGSFSGETVFAAENWPTSAGFWTYTKTDNHIATQVSLATMNGTSSSADIDSEVGYTTCVLNSDSAGTFSLSNISKVLEVGSQIGYRLTLNDPDGNPAPYQKIELSTLNHNGIVRDEDTGDLQEDAVVYTDADGGTYIEYVDNALADDVLTATFNDTLRAQTVYASRVFQNIAIDVTSEEKWHSITTLVLTSSNGDYGPDSNTLKPFSAQGLPLFHGNRNRQTTNVYQESFQGEDWLYFMKYTADAPLEKGRYDFFIQQENAEPQKDWDQVNLPGVPQSDKAIAIVVDFLAENTKVYYGTADASNNAAEASTPEVRTTQIYQWIEKRADKMYYYFSVTEPIRPSEPSYVVDFDWAGIDPTQPFWVGIAAQVNPGQEPKGYVDDGYITEFGFIAYDPMDFSLK